METSSGKMFAAMVGLCSFWAAVTWFFWVGYVGVDDIFYARYAYLLHRPPMSWWEFRMPFILALRASFALFGTSEVAAAIPNLMASFALLVSTAWLIGWPRKLTWETNLTMVLATMIPLDVGFRSWPGATFFAGSLCGVGTACWLKGSRRMQYVGSFFFAIAFGSHETMVFYIGIFCGLSLLWDWKRFIKPAVMVGGLVALSLTAEAVAYQNLLGNPLARFKVASGGAAISAPGVDLDMHLSGFRFYSWPVEMLVTSKHFAGSLLLLFLSAAMAWRHFGPQQKLIFLTVLVTWAWLGWGTMVPWTYRPFFRQFHYYGPLLLGINTLLPAAVFLAFRPTAARLILMALGCTYFVAATSGGRWGQNFDASRALLDYASNHPGTTFLTDVSTMNQMYTMSGFSVPPNVICKNGPAVQQHLMLNKEPVGTPKFVFKEVEPQAILVNLEGPSLFAFDEEFVHFTREHPGSHEIIQPMRRKWLIAQIPGLQERPLATLSLGAEVIHLR